MNPSVVVIMGVSGSGKSTVGSLLAGRVGWEFEDGDWFHPASNVEKMHQGIPLTDEDRWPWLKAIAAYIDQARAARHHAVIASSALKRRYRDILIGPDAHQVAIGMPKLWISVVGVIQVDLVGGIHDAVLFLQTGAAAERYSSTAQHGMTADIVVGIDNDHRGALIARHDSRR